MGWHLFLGSLGLRIFTIQWFWNLEGFCFPSIPQLLGFLTLISVAALGCTQCSWAVVSQILDGGYVFGCYSVTTRSCL